VTVGTRPGRGISDGAKGTQGRGMSNRGRFKFVVEAGDRRSHVWNISIKKNDIYVSSSGQTKVSLHESGQYQWSIRAEQLQSAPYVPATGRHIGKWERATNFHSELVNHEFFILIPESELSVGNIRPEGVKTLPAPRPGFASRIDFLTIGKVNGIEIENTFVNGGNPVFCHLLRNGRRLMIFSNEVEINADRKSQIKELKLLSWMKAKDCGEERFGRINVRIIEGGVSGMLDLSAELPSGLHAEAALPPVQWVPNKLGGRIGDASPPQSSRS
jgi:hypothetical protein